uniref:AB hydrolase-1 domain-containing protein n=1 Tax=Candidozyma auris TaxID=498019 RepID=A0A0L0NPZ0_CANAR
MGSYKLIDTFVNDDIINQRISLSVPLDHRHKKSEKITIVANITQKYEKKLHHDASKVTFPRDSKPIAYIQGGPGFSCTVPLSNSGLTKVLLDNGYQIIFYDQRGTGLSTPLETKQLLDFGTVDEAVEYLTRFRADSIVEDLEHIRSELFGKQKWLIMGQSFGGFCCFTYLSFHQESLESVFVTGGVPPVGYIADDVYSQTYKRTAERNVHFYAKYPQDKIRVKEILGYLRKNEVILPDGGRLSVERFQQLGLNFGGSGGTDSLHQVVVEFSWALESIGHPTYAVLSKIQLMSRFDTNILYALFQECIYADGKGKATDWAADRLRYADGNEQFVLNDELLRSEKPVYFTGEMVYKSMFDDYAQLRPLKEIAMALHSYSDWTPLYDPSGFRTLTWEKVPVVAATYYYDQYVDFDLTMRVKTNLFNGNGNLRQYITSEFFHNGLGANPEKVVGSLLKLLKNEVD